MSSLPSSGLLTQTTLSMVIQVFYFDVELHWAADVRSSEYKQARPG